MCIDNHVLIWGVGEFATNGQEDMIDRTKRFLIWLENRKVDILIPSVIIAEFLMNIPHEAHPAIIKVLEKSFITAPFDTQAAAMYARIWREKKGENVVKQLQQSGRIREAIKVDCMMVAIAVVRGANLIYSNDTIGVAKIANGYVDVSEIPNIEQQGNLF